MLHVRFASLLLAGSSLAMIAAPSAAQVAPADTARTEDGTTTTATQDDSTTSGSLDGDIIVTAQNRAQNVQDVPIAINVVSGEAIRDAGVADFRDVDRIAPALNITQDSNYTRVTVRGVGTNSNDEAQDQSIAINVDGEYLNRPNVLNVSIFDLDRVEVLRGPQGTLYGRNATGGAINFITRKPGKDFGVNAVASYGNYDAVIVEGGVDIPFGDVGGLRLAGIYNKHDGYFYHPNLNQRSGTADTKAARATLRLTPVDGLTIDLAGEYAKVDNIIASFASVNLNAPGNGPGPTCALNGFVQIAPATTNIECVPANTNFLRTIDRKSYGAPLTGLSPNELESKVVRGRIQYDFGPATLTYTGGYRHTDQDFDAALHPALQFLEFYNKVETQSHELRLNGNQNNFEWQVGGFYFNEKLDNFRGLYGRFIGPNGSFINTFTRDVETESWAVFGQADVPITDQLTAVVGARYTKDDRKAVFGNYNFRFNSGPVAPTTAPDQILNRKADGEKFTYLVGLNFKPSDDTLIYAKLSTGYKAGGFDSVGPYDPESNTAYEAGVKLNFGETGQHIFNLSGYYYDYKDLQVSVLLNPAIGGQIFNAGKATIWGVEAEANFKLGDNDRFNASFNYLHAEYKELLASYTVFCVGCATEGLGDLDTNPNTVTQPNFAGNTPPQSPRFVITAGYDHIFRLGDAGSITASAFTRLKSAYFLDIFNYRDSRQESYTQTDLSLKYEPVDGNWSIQGFVRNLENVRPLTYAGFIAAGGDDVYNWQFGTPRTYGVRVGVNF